jgi:uncharacterized protein (DUF1330 family)
LCVLLWAREGQAEALIAYEDQVLALLADHGGLVLYRARTTGPPTQPDQPLEVHLIELPSEAALERYLADERRTAHERRTALAEQRERAVARTEVLRVDLV